MSARVSGALLPHQQRVVDEKSELEMTLYSAILGDRIAAF